jgi:Nitrate/nitrite transporter
MKKNKYLHGVLPMILINFPIGSVYCWTLFKEHVLTYTGFSRSTIEWCFSLAIFFLGMSAAFGGKVVEKNVKNGALITFIFFTLGWLLTGIGIHTKNPWLTLLGFGPIQGIGLGIGYLTPVKTLMIWFDDKKGFAAGLAIAGFGLAGVIANPIIGYLLEHITVYNVFYILTALYGTSCFIGYLLIHRPEAKESHIEVPHYSIKEIICNKKFILLWLIFFINIACGLALISQEKQIYDIIGIDSMTTIVLFCSINAIANVAGRLIAASIQDKVNKKHIPYYLMAIMSIIVCIISVFIPFWTTTTVMMIFIIQFFFGCGFACLPNILHQNYGIKQLATVHGLMLSGWAIAGLVGNQFALFIMNNYDLKVLYACLGIIYTIELIILIIWAKTITKKRA